MKILVAFIGQCKASFDCDRSLRPRQPPQQICIMRHCHEPGVRWSSQQSVILRREIHNFELQVLYSVVFSGSKLNVEVDLAQWVTWLLWCDPVKACVSWFQVCQGYVHLPQCVCIHEV